MRRTLLAFLLAAVPIATAGQYLGPPQEVPPPSPPPVESPEESAPPARGALPPAQDAEPEWTVRRLRVWATLGATFA
jgi:hypothetical protein